MSSAAECVQHPRGGPQRSLSAVPQERGEGTAGGTRGEPPSAATAAPTRERGREEEDPAGHHEGARELPVQ